MKKILSLVLLLTVITAGLAFAADDDDAARLKKKMRDLEQRLRKVERQSALDRMQFTGDFRFEVHNIDAEISPYFDGMELQNLTVGTMFYFLNNFDGMDPMTGFPGSVADIGSFIQMNSGDYMAFANSLTFDQLKEFMGGFSPAQQQMLMGMLMPATAKDGSTYKNDVLYTNRLRLNMEAEVADDVNFAGRLTMYKPWGDSSGVQVFNGQSNSLNIDGTSGRVPNSDILRVERAYFNWRNIADTSLYLSIGRRPSAGGPPLHFRDDEMRAGTPLGTLIDFAFDGITAGFDLYEGSTFRLCYGLGYETGFGSAENLLRTENRLKDAHFLGINWDMFNKDGFTAQSTVARAFDVTDGFNGLVVLPDNPVSGDAIGAPMVMRFTPSANLGDIDLAGILLTYTNEDFDFFASYNVVKSHPDMVTTPFGGLFCDPFETPEEQTGSMGYVGARYKFANDKTKVGVEFNQGSEYWFNFSMGADDIFAPKTGTRGTVMEFYLTHRIADKFLCKLDVMQYDYDYSGSGWHLGSPKALDGNPILGYPTWDDATVLSLSTSVRF